MLQLDILSGKQAGARVVARHFPFSVGRSHDDHLQINEPGVWNHHFSIDLAADSNAFVVQCDENAVLIINGENTRQAALKNGDLLELGSAKLRIGLTPLKQKSLIIREVTTWSCLGILCLVQIFIIYWLSK